MTRLKTAHRQSRGAVVQTLKVLAVSRAIRQHHEAKYRTPTDPMDYFWAKTNQHDEPGISVRDHCLNVGCVAEAKDLVCEMKDETSL
jgi:hypothetical protein